MKNVREIGPGREQDDITGNYSKFREMISYARMHEGSENRVYYFQSMAHGDVETKVHRPGSHQGLGALPLRTIAKAKETLQGTTNGSCTSQWLLLDRMRVKINAKQLRKFV